MRILITGGAGFIGSHFVRYCVSRYPSDELVVLDKLTYAGRRENLRDVASQIRFVRGDICHEEDVAAASRGCSWIFNFAAESHVDRSIAEAGTFVQTNEWGTYVLLEAARRHDVQRFVQISTDEVYGSRLEGAFVETDLLNPSSPYAASKASADLLALAYHRTYGLDVVITRSANNFGPFQYPEKLIPLFVLNALEGKPLPVYGDGRNVRDWLYVVDNCAAIDLVARKGTPGQVYNIAAGNIRENLDVARTILDLVGASRTLLMFVADRPGHDRRYALDTRKVSDLGWSPSVSFDEGMRLTVQWYRENAWWWTPLRKSEGTLTP